MYRDKTCCIDHFTNSSIVLKTLLGNFEFRIDRYLEFIEIIIIKMYTLELINEATTNLECIFARLHVRYIHPLAINIVTVNIRAIDRNALISEICTSVSRLNSRKALIIFKTKGGFMSFRYPVARRIEDIKSGEYLHRVIMP